MAELTDKRIVITSAGSGIGRATAERAAAQGAKVLAVDINDSVDETVARIAAADGTAVAERADVGDETAVQNYVNRCIEAFGGIDGIYANAGIGGGGRPLLELTVEDWQKTLRVNHIGPFLAVKHAAPYLIEQGGGSIVCTASVAGLRSGAGSSPYSASKAGVISLVQTSANQLSGTNVRVNAICPGLTETGMTKAIFDGARAAGRGHRIGQLNPSRRGGRPEEIAAAALFLASNESSYVNGQAVDGGLSSSHPFVRGRMS